MRRERWDELLKRQQNWLEKHPRSAIAIFAAALALLSGFAWGIVWMLTTPPTSGQTDQALHVPTWQAFAVVETATLLWVTWDLWKALVLVLWKTRRSR